MKKPFKTLKKELLFNFSSPGRDFNFYRYTLLFPNNKKGDFIVRNSQPFTIIIPQLNQDNFIMVKQYRLGSNKISLEFPMGSVRNLSPSAMAKQELKEETGYTAKKLRLLGWFYLSPAWSNQKAYVYLAKDLISGKPQPEDYEIIEIEKKSDKEIEKLIANGEINDAPTIVAFFYYKIFQSYDK